MLQDKYSEYSDSGLMWVREYPSHWNLTKVKYEAYVKARVGWHGLKTDDFTDVGPYLVTGSDFKSSIISWKDCYHCDLARYEQDPYIQLQNGDLLLTKDGTIGKIALVQGLGKDEKATLNSGVFVVRPLSNGFTTEFYFWLLESTVFKKFFDYFKTGSTIVHLYQDTFVNFSYASPPLSEQAQIAKFLDHETTQIDTLIEKQQTLIQLLKEKRQAVISHAVTKGLNPDAPMKDSGVEWLGEVPEHWEVTKAKYISDIFIPQRNKPELNAIEGCPWVTMEDMKSQYIDKVHRYVKIEAMQESGSKVLKAGAVIASCVGNFGVTSINRVDVIINQQLQAFQPKRIKPEYLQAIVALSKSYFELIGTAATLIYVNREGFENLPVVVPTMQEQEAISEFIDMKSKQFDLLVSKAEQAIQLMQERRTALISAAVTGKIDVRDWEKAQ